jgi:uncharacterized repeat protein (TIGR02059 family)
VTVGYNPGALTASQKIRDTANNDTAQFVNQAVTNTTPDTVVPTVVSRTINGSALTITYSEALDTGSTPAPSAFEVIVNGSPTPEVVQTVSVSGTTVTLTLASPVITGDTATVKYTAGGSPIRDASSNNNLAASDGSAQTVTNNTAVPPPPFTPPVGPPPSAPSLVGSNPADGATVESAFSITLTASADVYWTKMFVDFTPAGSTTKTTTTLNDEYSRTLTPPVYASARGVYTIRGDLLNAGGRVPFSITFTVNGAGAAPPTGGGPQLVGAIPNDGTTVTSLPIVTLVASADVTWSGMTLTYDAQTGGTVPAVSTLPGGSGRTLTLTLNATTPGVYTVSGTMSNGTGSTTFDTHFSVYVTPAPGGPPSDPPPSSVNVVPGTAGVLTAAGGLQSVTWTTQSWPADAAELHVDPAPVTASTGGFSVGGTTLDVQLVTSGGARIHALPAAIEIDFDTADGELVPATSEDGIGWRALPVLDDHLLPATMQDGYWRQTLADGTFRIHIYTRHLTLFALLKDTTAPSTPSELTGTLGAGGLTLSWKPATDNSGVIDSYTIVINGHAAQTVPGSQTSALVSPVAPDDARVYQVLAQDAAGNTGSLSAAIARIPTVVGLNLPGATAKITQAGFTVGKVIQIDPGTEANSTVTEQSPSAAAYTTVGTAIDLKLSASSGRAQLAVAVYSARRIAVRGKPYIALRVSSTIPARLTVYLRAMTGKRYTHWVVPRIHAGTSSPRLLVPATVHLRKGQRYRLDLYFRNGGQRVVRHVTLR